ncbi:bifunctional tRNA pseudouridine(32) synthase/23S rRNA pseudouridine(746) synthase RluA [Glaciecola sp. KUL10]|uniref:bifunctional tRNA pseudouridine(32) synthase/23S rRNA pseudouridine(746) synthase RluA n=1 Tax=Glaciecola sp. (strain KUL10) TaxID=2161813 RepID=UPI000D78762A|nr:bifunctional tRNA pseudouridine(32) synthase/23S rRNA pseudouridine(746) synthase RluA [Glaciecola sp. KUL10]GBL03863.1 pseudouridylate synthase [Glaciecola sp. KUL10]
MALLNYKPPMNPYLDILYRDNDLLVLNKQAGLLSVPGKAPEHKDCLQYRAQRAFPTATVVHRLDMATSGVIIFALNKSAHVNVSRQLETRQTDKTYFARVYGMPLENEGIVDLPLICDWPNRPKQMVDHERGKPAQTHWSVVESDAHSSLIKLKPITGRSHQLRVHMLALGYPILGDKLYAHEQAKSMSERLCLHAQSHTITHPTSGQTITFSSEFIF